MISKKIYNQILQYSLKLSKHPDDAEDIAQNSAELLIKNPVDGKLPNKFYFTLTKRGANRLYYKPNNGRLNGVKTNKILLNRETVLENEVKFFNLLESQDANPETIYMLKELTQKMYNLPLKNGNHWQQGLTKNEQNLLLNILEGKETSYKDRGHYNNLKNKLIKWFK